MPCNYHILIDDKPKCEAYDDHWEELFSVNVTCGHTNIKDAESAVRKIQAVLPKCKVIVQVGECPAS